MTTVELIVAYAAIGLVSAVWILVQQGRAAVRSAIASACLWPIWLPFAFTPKPRVFDPEAARILSALESCDGYLDDGTLKLVSADLTRIAERRAAVERELARLSVDATCRARLDAIRERDAREMAELVEVAEQLRTELMLTRYGSATDVRGLVDELRARVEGLQAVTPRD